MSESYCRWIVEGLYDKCYLKVGGLSGLRNTCDKGLLFRRIDGWELR
jgi:hypothetical protein